MISYLAPKISSSTKRKAHKIAMILRGKAQPYFWGTFMEVNGNPLVRAEVADGFVNFIVRTSWSQAERLATMLVRAVARRKT
jgi:hypothetical protein